MPSVSIVVPIHDAGDYLAECLASIERQTLEDIEVICVDDASSDDSQAICECFAADDARFKFVPLPENIGVARARNRGIDVACGEFIMFIDADDWLPYDETLEHLYRAAVDHDAQIAGGSMSVVDMETGEIRTDYKDAGHLSNYYFAEDGMVEYRDWQGDYGFMRFIYSKELLVREDVRFPPLIRHEDPVFFVKAMLAAQRFYALAEVTYRYRINHKSYVLSEQAIDDAVEAHIELLSLADRNDLPILREWVVETLRWYLSTQTPEIVALREELYEVYHSTTFKVGDFFAAPYHKLLDMKSQLFSETELNG